MNSEITPTLMDQLGILGYPLFLCGCVILAIVLERLFFFLTTYPLSQQLIEGLVKEKQPGLNPELEEQLNRNRFGKILQELLERAESPVKEREDYCSIRLIDMERSLTRYLPVLKIMATVSPLLGLLGTVLGMIDSFQLISTVNKPITPALVSGGISQALLTTAIGLMLAMLALVPMSLFQMRANRLMQQLSQQLNLVNLRLQEVDRLKRQL